MFRIRRFGVVRTANLAAVLYFLLTLIVVLPFVLILLASGAGSPTPGLPDMTGVGVVFALIVPFLYAGLGWVFTALACLLYNLAARFTGGIEVEVTREQLAQAPLP